ncbi:YceI family protein [Emcibacter sp.]|uniref:YceI family protein n=1 Tax=Emcibacter sp. TaxID=1979954 RepID=UPI003A949A35
MKKVTGVFLTFLFMALLPVRVSAAEWIVDYDKSRLGFSGLQTGNAFTGIFESWAAHISLDPEDLSTAAINVEIDMSSVDTFDKQRNEALPGADWFDVSRFPKAIFKSARVTHLDHNHYEAAGTLTIRGVSKQVTLPFRMDINGDEAIAIGGLTLVRSDYEVGQNMWSSGQWVGLDVKVTFELRASRGE